MLPRPATTVWSSSAALRLVFLPAQAAASRLASKALPSGSGPTIAHQRMRVEFGPGTSSMRPNRRGSLKVTVAPDDMWNTTWSWADAADRAGDGRGRASAFHLTHAERAGHAEMHQQHVARAEIRREIFGAAAEPGDGLAFEPLGEIGRQRPAQIRPARLDPQDARALHHGRKPARARFRPREVLARCTLPVHFLRGFDSALAALTLWFAHDPGESHRSARS